MIVSVLILSILLQLLAAGLALKLIKDTKRRIAWIVLAAAIVLMAIRRGVTLVGLLTGATVEGPKIAAELIAFAISSLMVLGIARLAPLFHAIERSEQAMRESEKRYRTLIENIPIGIYRNTPGPRGKFLMANPAFCEMLGFPSQEALKKTAVADIYVNPDERAALSDHLLDAGSVTGVALELKKRDGTPIWGSITARVVRDDEGDVKYFDGTIEDITKRKRAEKAIQASEERYRGLFEDSPISVWEEDFSRVKAHIDQLRESGVEDFPRYFEEHPEAVEHCASLVEITDVNQATLEMYEVPSKQALLGSLGRILSDRTHSIFRDELIAIAEGKTHLEAEAPTRTYKDNHLYFSMTWQVASGYEETLSRVLVSIIDITQQKRTEKTLRQRTAQLEALQEIALAITAQLEIDELLEEIVERGRRLLGVSGGCLYLVDEVHDDLRQVVNRGYRKDHTDIRLARGEGVAGQVWQRSEPVMVEDYRHWEGRSPSWENENLLASLGVPLKHGDQVTGTLGFDAMTSDNRFTEQDLWLANLFASQASIAIHNAQLFDEAHRRTSQLVAVAEVAERITSILSPDDLLRETVEQISETFHYYYVSILLLDETTDKLTLAVSAGDQASQIPSGFQQSLKEGMVGWAAYTGETQLANDVSQNPHYIPAFLTETRSELDLPLEYHDKLIGVVNIQSREPHAFDKHDVMAMEALANHIATAIENARLYEEARRQTAQLEALHEVSLALTAQLNLDELLHAIVKRAISLVGGNAGGLNVYQPEQDVLDFAIHTGFEQLPDDTTLRRGEGMAGKVWESGSPIIIENYATWEGRSEVWREHMGRFTDIGVPVRWGEEFLGVLEVMADPPHTFSSQDAELLNLFATQAAIALRNARLYKTEQAQRQEAETLRRASLALTTALERDEVVARILAQLQQVVPYDTASVMLLRDNTLKVVGGRGFPNLAEIVGLTFSLTNSDNPNRQVIRQRASLILDDAPTKYAEFQREPHAQADIHSWLGVPMLVGEQPVGMIALDKRERGFYTQEQVRLAEAFAAQAAIAVENARLFAAEQEQKALAEALEEAAAAVNSTLDLEQVLDRILTQVGRVVGGDACNIMLVEGQKARIVRRRGYSSLGGNGYAEEYSVHIDDFPKLTEMAQCQVPVLVEDTAISPDWVHEVEREIWRSYVGAPIQVSGMTVGFLNVNSTRPGQFTPEDLPRLEAFARHAATAIENAQLYQELRGYADELEERVAERTAQLQAQYARLEAILDSSADGIVVTDAQGNTLQVNPIARRWLEQTLSPEEARRLKKAIRDASTRAEEHPVNLLELKGLDLELSAAPISMESDEAAAVVMLHDVTHLRALDRMKTRFITNISHELRTPITTINLLVEMMARQPDEWRNHLKPLAQDAKRLTKLVEDILEISRVDAGRVEITPQPTALNELTQVAIANHHVLADEREVNLLHRPSNPSPYALVDPQKMGRVLNNLVINALRYTPEGGRVIVSTDEKKAKGRPWATVTVKDTGIGIPEEEMSHIFERFFRGEGPRAMQIAGTGLGLSIVKEIVELHGGRVTVESKVGKGSTFIVWLPVAD